MTPPVPSANGTHPPDPEAVRKLKRRLKLASNPGARYAPRAGGALFGAFAANLIDGSPVFTWLDVPRMLRDPEVRHTLRMFRAPMGGVKFKVTAERTDVQLFVARMYRTFWRKVALRMFARYDRWGFACGLLDFKADRKQLRLVGGRPANVGDVHPRVYVSGPLAGQFAGVDLVTGLGTERVGKPHVIWFAGEQELGRLYDRPPIAGAHEDWLEKRGRSGAVDVRRLWYRKNSHRSGTIRYPDKLYNVGTASAPVWRHARDIALEQAETAEAGASTVYPNDAHPGIPGKYAWEQEPPQSFSDVAGIREYPQDLDKGINKGIGVPPEVIEANKVGGGWSGRVVPLMAFLGSLDMDVALMAECFEEQAGRDLVYENFGKVEYHVEPVPLIESVLGQGQPAGGSVQVPGGVGGQAGPPGGDQQQQPGGAPGGGGGDDGGDLAKLFGDQPGGGSGGSPVVPFDGPRGGHWLKDLRTGKLRHRAGMAHGDGDPAPAATPGGLDPEHAAALYYALLATAEHGQRAKADPEHTRHALDALADLAAHPEELGRLLHAGSLAHWVPFQTRRGTVGALNPETQRKLYGQRAQIALEGHAKRSAREASSAKARELLRQVYFGEAQGPEHFAELADHLPSLNVDQLKAARTYLGRQFPDARRRDELVTSLVRYAQDEAARRRAVGPDEYGLPPGQQAAADRAAKDEAQRQKHLAKGAGAPTYPQPGRVYSVPTAGIHVDPARFQYKVSGIGDKGVTDELKDVQYDKNLAGVVHLWRDPANGLDYVVNGHHRHERAGAAGVSHQNAMYIDAKSPAEARAAGALINIAEGKGTAVDAAKFFRDTGTTPEDLKKRNVPVKGSVARDGATLSKLADPLFSKLAQGRLEQDRALALAANLPHDPDGQVKLLAHIEKQEDRTGKDVPARVVAQAAQDYATAPTQTKTENTLFGTTAEEESLFLTRAELKSWVKGQLVKHAADYRAVSDARRAEAVSDTGNVLNVEANKQEAAKAAGLVEDFDRQSRLKGKVADVIDRYTKEYANAGKHKDAVKARLLTDVRAALAAPDGGAEGPADRAAADAAQPADAGAAAGEPAGAAGPVARPISSYGVGGRVMVHTNDHGLRPAVIEETDKKGTRIRWTDGKTPHTPTMSLGGGPNEARVLPAPAEDETARPSSYLQTTGQRDIFGGVTHAPRPSPKAEQQSLIPRDVERKADVEHAEEQFKKIAAASNPEDEAAPKPKPPEAYGITLKPVPWGNGKTYYEVQRDGHTFTTPLTKEQAEDAARRAAERAFVQSMTKEQAKAVMKTIPTPEHLPDTPTAYFNTEKADESVPLFALKSTRARPDGIENAAKFMEGARLGKLPKRDPVKVADFRGFGVYASAFGPGTYLQSPTTDQQYPFTGSLRSMEAVARGIPHQAQLAADRLARANADYEKAKESVGKPFPKAGELRQKTEDLKKLEQALLAGGVFPHEHTKGDTVELADGRHATLIANMGPHVLVEVGGHRIEVPPESITPNKVSRESVAHKFEKDLTDLPEQEPKDSDEE